MKDLKSKMEVLIFISENPISLKNISEFLNIDKNEAEILINDLMNEINNLRRSFKLEKLQTVINLEQMKIIRSNKRIYKQKTF
ncbi:hypothetical protein CM15mP43_05990 [bacterium]|nr:MAG: hypothetical protein CM15mP43_05990 [bacterium]